MRKKITLTIFIISIFIVHTVAAADQEEKSRLTYEAPKDDDQTLKGQRLANTPEGTTLQEEDRNVSKEIHEFAWLPDWPNADTHFYLIPISLFSKSSIKNKLGEMKPIMLGEFGLSTGIKSVDLISGNRGANVTPFATLAFGNVSHSIDYSAGESIIPENYSRILWGAQFEILLNFYRHQLTLAHGRLGYGSMKMSYYDVTSTEIENDFGVLLLPHLSVHVTNSYINASHESWNEPTMVIVDNWMHGRYSTSFHNFFFDLGPGMMFLDSFETTWDGLGMTTIRKLARSRVEYLKALAGIRLFSKVVLTGDTRYIYSVSEVDKLNQNPFRLPKEDLNSSRSVLNQNQDTFKGNLFLGLDDITYGMGLGLHYNVQIDRLFYSKDHKIRRNYGFGVNFLQSF